MVPPSTDAHTAADRAFHDATADLYEANLKPIFGAYEDLIAPRLDSLARRAPGINAVDVGCGTGVMSVALALRGFRVQGVDHSPAMLEIARARLAAAAPAADVELLVGDVRALPFGDGEVDFLACQGVLHHLEDIPATVEEFARVLAPGGVFFLAEPCQGSNLALRSWMRVRSHWERLRRREHHAGGAPVIDIPDHQEGPHRPR